MIFDLGRQFTLLLLVTAWLLSSIMPFSIILIIAGLIFPIR